MRRNNTQPLGQVLKEYVDTMRIGRKLKESRIEDYWREILGNNAAGLTSKLYIKNKVLYVHLNSAVLRNDLLMMRKTIITRINEKAEEELIKKVVLR